MGRFITLHLPFLSLVSEILSTKVETNWPQYGNVFLAGGEEGEGFEIIRIQWSIQLCKITLRLVLIILPLSSFNLKQENTYDLLSERRTCRISISAFHLQQRGFLVFSK